MNEWLALLIGSPLIILFIIAVVFMVGPIFFMPFLKETRGGFWQIVIVLGIAALLYHFFVGFNPI